MRVAKRLSTSLLAAIFALSLFETTRRCSPGRPPRDHLGHADVGFADGDFNCDGAVDGADYTLWMDSHLSERSD